MALPIELQKKRDAAQLRLDAAKSSYSDNVVRYNDWTSSIQGCYKDQIPGASDAASWYNPKQGPCTASGKDCNQSSVANCKNVVDKLNADIIPALRAAYAELNSVQGNFDKVLAEVAEEIKNDPDTIKDIAEIEANAKTLKSKWIFLGLCILIILGAGVYLGLKTQIKKIYIIGGGVALILLLYVVFFGINKKS